jgi:hypothetical protein
VTRRLAFVLIALVGLASVGFARPAAATRTCRVDETTGIVYCVLVANPAPDRATPLGDSPIVWTRLAWTVDEDLSRGLGCIRTVGTTTEIGQAYFVFLTNTATGERLMTRTVCVMPGDPAPQPPPAPPTLGEFVLAADEVLTLTPSLNPPAEFGGITGLDTWLWCTNPGTVAVSISLRGWTADATVDAVNLDWNVTGADASRNSARACGDQDDPAATWQPQAAGDHAISLATTWAGSWDLTYQGTAMGTYTLGPVTVASPATGYPVDEFVGTLEAG